jgi:hypothetical protein
MSSTEREHLAAAFALEISHGIFVGCVAAMDGWLCAVRSPPSRATDGAGPRAYYSGHYSRMGINVQACCDALSRFVFTDMSHPGGTNDIRAYRESVRPCVVEAMEAGFSSLGITRPKRQITSSLHFWRPNWLTHSETPSTSISPNSGFGSRWRLAFLLRSEGYSNDRSSRASRTPQRSFIALLSCTTTPSPRALRTVTTPCSTS